VFAVITPVKSDIRTDAKSFGYYYDTQVQRTQYYTLYFVTFEQNLGCLPFNAYTAWYHEAWANTGLVHPS